MQRWARTEVAALKGEVEVKVTLEKVTLEKLQGTVVAVMVMVMKVVEVEVVGHQTAAAAAAKAAKAAKAAAADSRILAEIVQRWLPSERLGSVTCQHYLSPRASKPTS